MMPCPHCSKRTISAWRKLFTKWKWSVACPECGGSITISGWSRLISILVGVVFVLFVHLESVTGLRALFLVPLLLVILAGSAVMLRIPFARS